MLASNNSTAQSLKRYLSLPLLLMLSGISQAQSLDLKLICSGSGSKSDTQTTITTNRNKSEHTKEIGTEQAMIKRAFTGTMSVEIHSDMGRLKLPMAMLPPFQKDEAADWFTIDKLKITDTEITGEVRINFLNKPDVRIDRTIGTIIVANGLNEFSGECTKQDENAKPKF